MEPQSAWSRLVIEKRRSTLFALALAIGLYGVFGVLDGFIFPGTAASMLPIRAAVIACLVAQAGIIVLAPGFYLRHSQVTLSLCVLAGGIGIILLNLVVDGQPDSATYYAGLIMVIVFLCVLIPLRFRYVFVICLALVLAYNVSLLYTGISASVAISNNFFLVGATLICCVSNYDHERLVHLRYAHEDLIERQTNDIAAQKLRADKLLHQILPDPIADRLMDGANTIADGYSDVTVLFADLVGFTEFSSTVSPRTLVKVLNRVFSGFDEVAERCGVEKIKTIGDAYMAACGVPAEVDDHAERILRMAVGMREEMAAVNREFPEYALDIRIGIHTGPCVAGIIGRQRFIYDLWGDTVNLASRMESTGVSGQVQVSETTYLRARHAFSFEPRGEIQAKGRGAIKAYLLTGTRPPGAPPAAA
ncbi:MAG: adenylate/guanylate cyclase domain-containing protein [Arenimonas sp.]|nr:adenylate/guanylate cyclase domain-containing protein [Arenimonas sp.]